MAEKIYRFIEHRSNNGTRYVFVKASSKKKVAEIVGRPLSHIVSNMSVVGEEQAKGVDFDSRGVGVRAIGIDTPPEGICSLDLERIAAIGYLTASHAALQNCEIQDRELRARLNAVLVELKELKGDVAELLLSKYEGR